MTYPTSPTETFRRFYADFIVRSSASTDTSLIEAFASIPREKFLGPGPWPIYVGPGYIWTPTDDPRFVYQDVLVGLSVDRKINNGQPSLHAMCLAALAPALGERAIHVGAGTGYYSAVLAHLVGEGGHVTAYEIQEDLAARASENLRDLGNVRVVSGSGSDMPLPQANMVYVSAGATHPLDTWLDSLTIGGRLLFPLTQAEGYGCMLLATRDADDSYRARSVMGAAFIPCVGARDEENCASLTTALRQGAPELIRSLRRSETPDETAWCAGNGWWLSTAEVN
ncbi:MAG: methyltransferase domain-containing protein [Burkholderiaceae bacterium]